MLDVLKEFTLEDALKLSAWTRAWYDQVIAEKFVHPPYHPENMTIKRLRYYFHRLGHVFWRGEPPASTL